MFEHTLGAMSGWHKLLLANRVVDCPQMPTCPGRTALGAATEKVIKWPFAIKAKRLKRRLRPAGSRDEFRPFTPRLGASDRVGVIHDLAVEMPVRMCEDR